MSVRVVCPTRSCNSQLSRKQNLFPAQQSQHIMYISQTVFQEIFTSFPAVPPENGGILGQKDGVICAYLHDRKEQSADNATYCPDVQWMNTCIEAWEKAGIQFAGIVHSHPGDNGDLSTEDRVYICEIMAAMPDSITELLFPIMLPGKRLVGHIARKVCSTVIFKDIPIILTT